MNLATLHEARLFIVPLLRLLQVPVNRRGLKEGRRGEVIGRKLLKAAARWSNVSMEAQAMVLIEQHICCLHLLENPDTAYGSLSPEQMKAEVQDLGPAYIKALADLGYTAPAPKVVRPAKSKSKSKSSGASGPKASPTTAGGTKGDKAKPSAEDDSIMGL